MDAERAERLRKVVEESDAASVAWLDSTKNPTEQDKARVRGIEGWPNTQTRSEFLEAEVAQWKRRAEFLAAVVADFLRWVGPRGTKYDGAALQAALADATDAASARFAKLERDVDARDALLASAHEESSAAKDECARLRGEVAALRADKVRLDWIEKQGSLGLKWIARQSVADRGYRLHQILPSEEGWFGEATGNTPREAIDAALSGEKGGTDVA